MTIDSPPAMHESRVILLPSHQAISTVGRRWPLLGAGPSFLRGVFCPRLSSSRPAGRCAGTPGGLSSKATTGRKICR